MKVLGQSQDSKESHQRICSLSSVVSIETVDVLQQVQEKEQQLKQQDPNLPNEMTDDGNSLPAEEHFMNNKMVLSSTSSSTSSSVAYGLQLENLSLIPSRIILEILRQVQLKDLFSVAQVCKRLNNLIDANEKALWKELILKL